MTAKNSNAQSNDVHQSDDPFIWGHIALIAGVPWLLTLSMAGLAVGDPVFPAWLEIFLLGVPAIALVAWVQWQQPFSPFCLWFVTKPTERLSDRDLRVLTLVKQQRNGWYITGWMAIAVAILMGWIFCKIYDAAPLAQAIAPFPNWLRLLGVLWAEFFFLIANVLLQSGISALRIRLTAESEIIDLSPFATEKIKNNFTNIGWRSPQLLKFFKEALVKEDTRDLINPEGSEVIEIRDRDQVAQEAENIEPSTSEPEFIEAEIEADLANEIEPTLIKSDNIDTDQLISKSINGSKNEAIAEISGIAEISDSELGGSNSVEENLEVQSLEVADSKLVEFDDEMDESIALNMYVENILLDYLEESVTTSIMESEITDSVEAEVADIVEFTEIFVTSTTSIAIVEEVLNIEQVSLDASPKTIADSNVDANIDPKPKDSKYKDSKYLVEEFLVDKYLAKLEALNNADKINKSSIHKTEPIETDAAVDEFADLEAIIDGKPLTN